MQIAFKELDFKTKLLSPFQSETTASMQFDNGYGVLIVEVEDCPDYIDHYEFYVTKGRLVYNEPDYDKLIFSKVKLMEIINEIQECKDENRRK